MKKVKHRSHERKIVFAILILAAIAGLVLALTLLFSSRSHIFRLVGGSTVYYADDETRYLSGEPVIYNSKQYIPAGDILEQCGYTTRYNSDLRVMAVMYREIKSYIYADSNVITYNDENVVLDDRAIVINDIMYVTPDMLSKFTDSKIIIEGNITEVSIPQ